jgi:hypothetical protein
MMKLRQKKTKDTESTKTISMPWNYKEYLLEAKFQKPCFPAVDDSLDMVKNGEKNLCFAV